MATPNYPSIPDPTATLEGLRDSVLAIKQVLEILTGQRGGGGAAVITNDTLPPPPVIPPAFPPTGGTLTGNVIIDKDEPRLSLNKTASGQYAAVQGDKAGVQRWFMALGNADAETGGNLGSNFSLHRYNDAGGHIGVPMTINRSTGAASFEGMITATSGGIWAYGWSGIANQGVVFLNAAQNRYLHYNGTDYSMPGAHLYTAAGRLWGSNDFNYTPVNKAGDTITGHLVLNSGAPQMRLKNGSYSALLHQDGSHLYLLTTNAGDPDGSYNSLRPFYINLSTGYVTMNHNVTIGNGVVLNARASGNPAVNVSGSDIIGIGGPMNTIQVAGAPHAGITFLSNGVFGANFGISTDGNFYCGGWSFGAGVYYNFWTWRNLAASTIKQAARHVYVNDIGHARGVGLSEPYAYAYVTGCGVDVALTVTLRYRYLQLQGVDGVWYTQSGTA